MPIIAESSKNISVVSLQNGWTQWLITAGLIYLLLVAVALIGSGLKAAAGDQAKQLLSFAGNPFTALVIGTFTTALIQSSSTVTSIIVGLVAGGLPVATAVPMVMGANIGTTITNTIVSLGHLKQGEEFKRAFAAATIHDFFNVICVLIFLPLEIAFSMLERIGKFFSDFLVGGDSISVKGLNFIKPLVEPPVKFLHDSVIASLPEVMAGILMIVLGIALVFIVISFIGKLLRMLAVGKVKDILCYSVGRGPISGISAGTLITVLVQSSSTTTSLIVPLAGNGVFSLKQVYPFTLGANIGTCVTALLAATAVTGTNAIFALQIALVHFVYNVLGVVVIFFIPLFHNIPLIAAKKLADLASNNKLYVGVYILFVFVLLPFAAILISWMFGL